MKTKTILLALIGFFLMTGGVNAQKVTLESGNLSVIKGETKFNLEYDYSSMGVGKFRTEEEYVKTKVEEHNSKEPGKGDKWREGWVSARENRYQPKFEELINDGVKKQGMSFGKNPEAKYTLKVVTTYIEPGWNIGISKKPASANFKYIFYETANPSNVVATYRHNGIPGSQFSGYDFDAGSRIAESYAKGGKMLAGTIGKAVK